MKSLHLVAILLSLSIATVNAQVVDSTTNKDKKVSTLITAEYKGGINAARTFIVQNVKYPEEALRQRIQGEVIVDFVIDENGKVINPTSKSKVDEILKQEAFRIVKMMKNWIPAKSNGVPIKSSYSMPISFYFK